MPFLDKSTLTYPATSSFPGRRWEDTRDPTSADYKQFQISDMWYNTIDQNAWTMVGRTATSGTWARIGGAIGDIASIAVDAFTAPGTNPVVADADHEIAITGAQVATGTIGANVIRTDSLAANSLTIEIQRSTAVAATDSTKNGVSHFNSSHFSVDASGFVSLSGGQQAIDSFVPDTGTNPVVPTSGGAVTMTGGNGIQTTGGTNTLTFDMQSPFTGDFSFQSTTSGDTEVLTIENTSNTASSQATQNIKVAGTSSGDAWNQWTVGTTRSYALGIDNSASQIFKLTTEATGNANPSSADQIMTWTPSSNSLNFFVPSMAQSYALPGQTVDFNMQNIDSTNAASDVRINLQSTQLTGGDPYLVFTTTGTAVSYAIGKDVSDSEKLKITKNGASLSSGTTIFDYDQSTDLGSFRINQLYNQISRVGSAVEIGLTNADNTNTSSAARLTINVGGLNAGDPYVLWNNGAGTGWKMGLDHTDTYAMNIRYGADAGVSNIDGVTAIKITIAGEISYPTQPAFSAYQSANTAAVTGNGTVHTVICDTKLFDQADNYDSTTGVFTAPVTGKYLFDFTIQVFGLTAGHTTGQVELVTTARTFRFNTCNPGAERTAANDLQFSGSQFVPMTAGDTAHIQVTVSGGALAVAVGGLSGAVVLTQFSGKLEC